MGFNFVLKNERSYSSHYYLKLSNLGFMLSDANNIHLKQEILGLHHHFYMSVKLGKIGLLALPYQIRTQYKNAVHSKVIYHLIFNYSNIMLVN